MAEITVAESAGFCFGVDRAVKLCYQALEEHHNIATLGPIIHNQDVVDDLTRRGARIVDSIAELHPDECVVIRSHGVSAKVYEELEQAGNPYVRLWQRSTELWKNIPKQEISSSSPEMPIIRKLPQLSGIVKGIALFLKVKKP